MKITFKIIKILTIILLCVFFFYIGTIFNSLFNHNNSNEPQKFVNFLEGRLSNRYPGIKLTLLNYSDSCLYKLAVDIDYQNNTQTVYYYLSKDGKYLYNPISLSPQPQPFANLTFGNYKVIDEEICKENGKPIIYFFGADFCPFCAKERIALIEALKHYGTFSGLVKINSSEGEVPTYSLANATYKSDYFSLHAYEVDEQKVPEEDSNIRKEFSSRGGVPLVVLGCKYYRNGAYSTSSLDLRNKSTYNYNLSEGQKKEVEDLLKLLSQLVD